MLQTHFSAKKYHLTLGGQFATARGGQFNRCVQYWQGIQNWNKGARWWSGDNILVQDPQTLTQTAQSAGASLVDMMKIMPQMNRAKESAKKFGPLDAPKTLSFMLVIPEGSFGLFVQPTFSTKAAPSIALFFQNPNNVYTQKADFAFRFTSFSANIGLRNNWLAFSGTVLYGRISGVDALSNPAQALERCLTSLLNLNIPRSMITLQGGYGWNPSGNESYWVGGYSIGVGGNLGAKTPTTKVSVTLGFSVFPYQTDMPKLNAADTGFILLRSNENQDLRTDTNYLKRLDEVLNKKDK